MERYFLLVLRMKTEYCSIEEEQVTQRFLKGEVRREGAK